MKSSLELGFWISDNFLWQLFFELVFLNKFKNWRRLTYLTMGAWPIEIFHHVRGCGHHSLFMARVYWILSIDIWVLSDLLSTIGHGYFIVNVNLLTQKLWFWVAHLDRRRSSCTLLVSLQVLEKNLIFWNCVQWPSNNSLSHFHLWFITFNICPLFI